MNAALPQTTLILGCGDLGGRVGAKLLERGGRETVVIGARRNVDQLPREFQRVAFDATEDESWPAVVATKPDAVVVAISANERSEEGYRRAYVEVARQTAERFAGSKPTRVIFVSSSAVYGQEDGSWIDEASPTEPTDFRGELLLEAEALLHDSPLRTVALRLTGIYGPGRTRLIDRVKSKGAPLHAETPPQWTNRIHVDDAASAVVRLLEVEQPAPVYLGVDDEPSTRFDTLSFIADRLGVTPGLDLSELPTRGNKRASNRRLRSTGWSPRFPSYREGYTALL